MIVIPMAGMSSRFKSAGYSGQKYMLLAKGQTIFEHSVRSFAKYFGLEKFLFITLKNHNSQQFIQEKAIALGISNFEIVVLEYETRGQAETVYRGLMALGSPFMESITIFNIDTFRPDFRYPADIDLQRVDGYLETFIGAGANWSNVVPFEDGSNRVKLTAEKRQLSKFCCTGIYYWRSAQTYLDVFEVMLEIPASALDGREYYVAPIYNLLISQGGDVRFSIICSSNVIFCGTPTEYSEYLVS